ncbi:MAG: tyrosine-type recombinase/integrase [Clostridiales bacterium]|nr:tyrosine-type recombinase/integrase [Clostridiales bacterium]MDY4009666.1 tyrosine-type recombinase/integrase [Candidatus Limiplasma sp.]
MANTTYQERLRAERTEKVRQMLRLLPASCADFINSITMTTSPLTRLAYTIDLQTFCDYATKELPYFASKSPQDWTDEDLGHFTARDLNGYADYLTLYYKDQAVAETVEQQKVLRNHECGVMRKLSSLRSYFDYLFKSERISGNIAALVSLPKLHEKPILHLIGPEIERLLAVADDGAELTQTQQRFHAHTRKRDYAILMLFLGTGMRVSECVGIDIGDLDLQQNAVLVTRKGGNQVILYYPQEVADALKAYLEERKRIEAADKADENALFLSLQRKRISQRAVQLMVKKYCAVAVPLKKRMSPHKLRSTYATRLYHETEDIYLVADALGHSDVNTTRRHYAAMSDERRREAAQNTHLPGMEAALPVPPSISDDMRLK